MAGKREVTPFSGFMELGKGWRRHDRNRKAVPSWSWKRALARQRVGKIEIQNRTILFLQAGRAMDGIPVKKNRLRDSGSADPKGEVEGEAQEEFRGINPRQHFRMDGWFRSST